MSEVFIYLCPFQWIIFSCPLPSFLFRSFSYVVRAFYYTKEIHLWRELTILSPIWPSVFCLDHEVALAQGKEFSFPRLCKHLCTQKKPTETEGSYLERRKSASFVGTARPVGNACESPDEETGPELLCVVCAASSRDGWRTLADVAPLGTRFSSSLWI